MNKNWMKLGFFLILLTMSSFPKQVYGEDFQQPLYARGAVLMDGDSGRVLYGKEEDTPMPMASTTKVMTCILALENAADLNEVVEVSENAAAQPDVQLNMAAGEHYYLRDLLYSLMLKSHNDTAVAIAEHIGSSVENFAAMMNNKARQLGCTQTHFVTPNGLDASDSSGVHSTTARELALIMRHAIQNDEFLAIVQTRDYAFTNVENTRQFAVHNTNILLDSMDGMLAGKTGFTGDAGYCYVCAVEKEDRVFVVALLGCGWPGNKTYKWKDTTKLIQYGAAQYHYRNVWREETLGAIPVRRGIPVNDHLFQQAYTNVEIDGGEHTLNLLLRDDEEIEVKVDVSSQLEAPVSQGDIVGEITYSLNGTAIKSYPVFAGHTIEAQDFPWYWRKIADKYFLGSF